MGYAVVFANGGGRGKRFTNTIFRKKTSALKYTSKTNRTHKRYGMTSRVKVIKW